MIRLFLGLFLIVMPVVELALLIKIGQSIGLWTTVALVLVMAATGVLIISQQGFTVLRQSLEAMSEGRPPVTQVLDGLFLMLAGALLLMPGFITDALALPLLVPPLRRAIGRWSIHRIIERVPVENDEDEQPRTSARQHGTHGGSRGGEGPVIEGEFERLSETSRPARRGNGASAH
jgi:UPF0716 protein FxsA